MHTTHRQAGMIRRKNSLSMLMQVLFGMVIGSLLWTAVGFSVAFGPSVGLFGNPFHYAFLRNVPGDDCLPELADTIPGTLFAAFQVSRDTMHVKCIACIYLWHLSTPPNLCR